MRIFDGIRRHPLVTYFLLAFTISWTAVLVLTAPSGFPADPAAENARYRMLALAGMLAGPSIASITVTAIVGGRTALRALRDRITRKRVPAIWYATLLIPPAALFGVLAVLSTFDPAYLPGFFAAPGPAMILLGGVAMGLAIGFFEELGWTGFATPRMIARYGVVRGGAVLGVVWMSWHLLADYWGGATYGSLYLLHVLQWFVALIALRVFMTAVYARTGSVLLGQLLHASSTGSQIFLWPAATHEYEMVWYSLYATLMVIVAAIAAGVRLPAIRRLRPA